MPLDYSAVVAIVGIMVLVAALYFFSNKTLDGDFDADHAIGLLKKNYPEFQADRVIFDSAGKGALILPQLRSPVGLVWQGRRSATSRLLTSELVRSVRIEGPQLTLRLNDARLPSVRLLIDDPVDIFELKRLFKIG